MATNGLPSQFWDLNTALVTDENMRVIYQTLVSSLRDELSDLPGYGVIYEMRIERTCYLYVYIRSKEATDTGFANDRAYKETMQLWDAMADKLSSHKIGAPDTEVIKGRILRGVSAAMNGALDKMHPDVAFNLRKTFADAFAAAEF
jgi:hypothetical protein